MLPVSSSVVVGVSPHKNIIHGIHSHGKFGGVKAPSGRETHVVPEFRGSHPPFKPTAKYNEYTGTPVTLGFYGGRFSNVVWGHHKPNVQKSHPPR